MRKSLAAFPCALCLAACTSATAPPAPHPTVLVLPTPSAVAPTPTATAAAEPAPITPPTDLGEGVAVRPFEPGHYAVDIRKGTHATHARNWYTEETRASFVLHLTKEGQVSGCRGHRSRSFNDGPKVHESVQIRDQQGYRGRWKQEDSWVKVELTLDNSVCPEQRAYLNLGPKAFRLRCLTIEPRGHAVLSVPALACQLENKAELIYDESYALLVPGVLRGDWLLLGRGNGLSVTWENDSVPPGERPPSITVGASATPVRDGTWAEP